MSDYQDPLFSNPSNSSQLLLDIQPIVDTVIQSIDATKNILTRLNSNSQIDEIMSVAFGQDYQKNLADGILQHLAQNDSTNTPDIKLVSGQSFNGAYAKEKNTIYLSQEFVAGNLGNVDVVKGVLLEEFGHYIDGQINVKDAAGDEGDIFSRLVQDQSISGGELLSLKAEDDTAVIFLNNQPISIEQQSTGQSNFDVNGDGKADIVGFYSDRIFVSIGNGNGNGTFKTATADTPGFTKNYGWNTFNDSPRMLADVNGDGKADIVGFDSDRIFVSIGNGNGTFKAATADTPGFTKNYGWTNFNEFPRMLADVNGDGKADIVGFYSDRIFVSIGNGNGTFKVATADTPGFTKNYGWTNFNEFPRMVGNQSLVGDIKIQPTLSSYGLPTSAAAADSFFKCQFYNAKYNPDGPSSS